MDTSVPVAVVGLSCRLPGAADPEAFWHLLDSQQCAVTRVPAGRADAGGRWGAFLPAVDRFDAAFFGITPREAAVLDPQQRLMLELAWEAVEDARIAAGALRDTATGVFVGAMRDDYALLLARAGRSAVNHHTFAGSSRGVIANRVAHFLGLRGPSLVIDAGQASSLVAVHAAMESLRRGESTLALAGGVNLNLAAETGIAAEEFGGLSPDGRCHTFDHRANGFVRGEGGVALVLRLLPDAEAAGDRIYAVLRGGAVNSGTGAALTVPSASAQAAVLRQAYASAGVAPAEVQYVELHGTGTPVGDPIEAAALGEVLGADPGRSDPLLVGSVKTNIGHLEAAAGAAGLLKAVLAIARGAIPASLHFEAPHPDIPLSSLGLRVASSPVAWAADAERIAGVSAFGMGGTNVHLVLAQAPEPAAASRPVDLGEAPAAPWVLSGRSEAAVRDRAAALAALPADAPAGAVAWSLMTTRERFPRRAVVLGPEGLTALAAGLPSAQVVSGSAGEHGRIAFVFPGQGAQWAGMGAALLDSSPVFARVIADCEAAMDGLVEWSLTEVLRGGDLDRVDVVQPASFAVMVGLAALWRSFGVEPAAVVGHSQGEIAAACVAGALSLTDAVRVVCLRSQAIAEQAGHGAMASIAAPVDEVEQLLPDGVSVAAMNSPSQTVVAGNAAAVHHLVDECAHLGVRARRIAVDYASHSPAMDALQPELAVQLRDITPAAGRIPLLSTVTEVFTDGSGMDGDYWFTNLRSPVRFAAVVEKLAAEGYGVFVEISSHPVLTAAVQETAPESLVVGSLRRQEGLDRFVANAAELWVRGAGVDWTALFPGATPPVVDLPTYPFQRERHWFGEVRSEAVPAAGYRSERELLDLVRAHAAAVLGHDGPAAIDPSASFKDQGFDSQSSVQLRNRLCSALAVTLPTGVLFDHPTPARLAARLFAETPEPEPVAARSDEPIAIVGMGCRFPGGVRTPEDLWELVRSGTDAIGPFPADRGWDLDRLLAGPGAPGGSAVREGGFLYDAGDFDAGFFGISPREALAMDPQQRLLLETAWEALERGGIDPSGLAGSRTGVFVGAMAQEYGPRLHEASDGTEGYALTGTAGSTASGRISYVLGLEGPALTVDTACSASLVALHLAVRSLRAGECTLALAGAATVMSRPGIFVEFSRQHGLAPDGRCKAFSDDADGTGWAEGAGTLVLERLSDAERHGHRVLALIEGTAVNQDGASNGLTAPNGPSQQRVIRQALADAGVSAADVDVVEAHGTGTRLGDPIEAEAILATYGRGRPADRPLRLGSLKSNLGHTQAAAGLGGVIKMVQAMRHGALPGTLHARTPSAAVDWQSGGVELLTEAVDWPAGDRPRRAGVSAFGISGTNAHVILASAPDDVRPAAAKPELIPYALSARTPDALREQARRLRAALRDPAVRPLDVAYTLATARARFPERAAALDLDGLHALADGGAAAGLVRGRPAGDDRVVLVFPGQGGQWAGMAAELLDTSEVFAARIAECEQALSEFVDWSLTEVLRGGDLERVDVVQPALWATMLGLTEVWRSLGIRPAAVAGHSQGEIAAACVAGALSLADGARVVALRSRALLALSGLGTMASVLQPATRVAELLAPYGGRISVAAVNGPDSVVVSGDTGAVTEFTAACDAQGIRARLLPVDYASHSAQVESIEDELARLLAPVSPRRAEIPFHSTVTATVLDGTELTGDYWYRNLRGTVRLEETVRALAASGHRVFLEASPHPTLTVPIEQTLESAEVTDGVAAGSLRRGEGGLVTLGVSLARLLAYGVEPDWERLFAGSGARRIELPTYPFERERFWWTPSEPSVPVAGAETSAWRYDVAWRPLPDTTPALTGTWLLLTGDAARDDAEAAAEALRRAGADVIADDVDGAAADAVSGVLSLHALGGGEPAAHIAEVARLLRALRSAGVEAPLWCATRGAVAAAPADPAPDPAAAALWGAGRAAAVELPSAWGGLVDLPAGWDGRTGARLAGVLAGPAAPGAAGVEDQVAIRSAGVFGRRLVRATRPATRRRAYIPSGTVLVTGGTGVLGRRLAGWLAARGAERVVLLSRGGGDPAAVEHLTDHDCEIVTLAADVADRESLAAALDGLALTAVFHAAGVCELAAIGDLRAEDLPALLAAKTEGARNLDELTGELDAFVLFSSISGTWGVGEHASYGAANAYLDALAARRRARGLTATSVVWGPWGGGGMIDESRWDTLAATGLPVLDPERALDELGLVLDQDETAPIVADVDWERFGPVFTAARPSPLLSELVAPPAGPAPDDGGLRARLDHLPADRQREAVLDLVREQTARVLGHPDAAKVAADRAFKELGFDSLTAVELRNRLGEATGARLHTTVVFDYPTPALLAEHLWRTAYGERARMTPEPAAARSEEPLAIVGMACRLPGDIGGPDELWRLLLDGGDAVGGLPADRGWDLGSLYDPNPDRHGTSYVRAGGFLGGAADFDHEFFGISAREALAMDPQQRLLLEASWEAFEHAGISPDTVKGSDTGVFAGVLAPDYGVANGLPGELEGYRVTGGAPSVASGRLSYQFGFVGPAITVDTACSSSLVALHLAGRALQAGECGLALVAGAAVMATPGPLVGFSRQRALSGDGRCRSFADEADGFGMAEGVGVLLVERLSEARRNGHRVLAVVRGSAVNQDGASNGLTAPNGPSQQRVIRQALANAGLSAADVDAVEAHGTGTKLGDPIEAQAILATYGEDRPADRPLWLGSVKSNVGHTQAAAGVVGVIKMVQALRHSLLPRTLHASAPTTRVEWGSGAVQLLTRAQEWPDRADRPRRAGVSAFGISGTNAHVILEQAPAMPEPPQPPSPAGPVPWLLSARTAEALRDRAAALRPWVADDPAAVARALLTDRAHLEHRAVVAGSHEAGLTALASGEPAAPVVTGVAGPLGRTVFVFPGQGAQWAGMGAGLLDSSEVFAGVIAECEKAMEGLVDWSLTEVLRGGGDLERVDVVQPASFAVMVGLAAVWRSFGLEPAAVVGHSQGEIAAACVSGALDLADAVRVVCVRSRILASITRRGGMGVVALPEAEVAELLEPYRHRLSIAAVNGPGAVVVSGDRDALEELAHACKGRIRMKLLPVDYASHSPHVEEILDELADRLAPIRPRRPEVPFLSTVTGEWVETAAFDAGYWCANLRSRVRFAEAVERLAADGHGLFVECSAHPVLLAAIEDAVPVQAVGSLRRDDGGLDRLLRSVAGAWVRGAAIDWSAAIPAGGRRAELPTYPFQRRRHWLETAARPEDGWRHRIAWKPVELAEGTELTGDWVVVTPEESVRPELVRDVLTGLARHGAAVRPLAARDLASGAAVLPERIDGILSLAALDERPGAGDPAVTAGLADTLSCVRELAAHAPGVPLWLATRGAVGTGPADPVTQPLAAQIWGLGVVLGLDETDRVCGLVDLPGAVGDDAADRLAGLLSGATGETEMALRETGAYARRLVADPAPDAPPWQPRDTVLITGGTGALGAHVARWAARNGAAHLVLTSRRGADAPGAAELRRELEACGARVTLAACDITDAGQVGDLIAAAGEGLSAVVHAAGVTQPERPVGEMSEAELGAIIRVKTVGARNLEAATAGHDLAAFVLFSSGAGTWGDAGKAGYAAANAYLDALAQHRRARGAVATSIAWGAWDGGGMVEGEVAELLTQRGMRLMAPALAIRALASAVGHGDTNLVVAAIDLERFVPLYTMTRDRRLVADLVSAERRSVAAEPEPAATGLAALAKDERTAALLDIVRREAAAVLQATPDEIRPRRSFKELGFDSLTALEFRNRLNAATGLRLPATLVYDRPTPETLARHLSDEFGEDVSAELDRLEAALAALDEQDWARLGVADRLRALLRRAEPSAAAPDELAAATNDELFDLIDRELGVR